MSGMYEQIRAAQKREAEFKDWRKTMVEHLKEARDEVERLTRENAMLKELLGSYAQAACEEQW